MILDKNLVFTTAQDVFSTDSTVVSTDNLDMNDVSPRPNQGTGEPIYVVIQVTTAFTGGTSAEFLLVSDNAANVATDGTASEHLSTGPIPVAELVVGKTIAFAMPAASAQSFERRLAILTTCVGAVSAGAITAFLTHTPDVWTAYADAAN